MITYALKKLLESRGLSSAGIKDIADAIERLTDDSYIRETLAKLIANLADGYSEDETYPVGDYVFYDDILYKCVEPVTVGEQFDPDKWVQTTIEEMFINADVSSAVAALANDIGPMYDPTHPYAVGDYAVYQFGLYQKTSGFTVAENWNPSHWNPVNIAEIITRLREELSNDILNVKITYNPTTERATSDIAGTDINNAISNGKTVAAYVNNVPAAVTKTGTGNSYILSFDAQRVSSYGADEVVLEDILVRYINVTGQWTTTVTSKTLPLNGGDSSTLVIELNDETEDPTENVKYRGEWDPTSEYDDGDIVHYSEDITQKSNYYGEYDSSITSYDNVGYSDPIVYAPGDDAYFYVKWDGESSWLGEEYVPKSGYFLVDATEETPKLGERYILKSYYSTEVTKNEIREALKAGKSVIAVKYGNYDNYDESGFFSDSIYTLVNNSVVASGEMTSDTSLTRFVGINQYSGKIVFLEDSSVRGSEYLKLYSRDYVPGDDEEGGLTPEQLALIYNAQWKSEEITELFDETLEGWAGGSATLSYSDEITADPLYVTFNGEEYTCSRNEYFGMICYGGFGSTGPDFSEYPFYIIRQSNNNTVTPSYSASQTFTISARGTITTYTDSFKKGVEKYSCAYVKDYVNPQTNEKTGGVVEGDVLGNVASGNHYPHAEGYKTTASGASSHAEGYKTTASGLYSHAEGNETTASEQESHAEGSKTTASGYYSHAEGRGTNATHKSQHVFGEYNVVDPSSAIPGDRGNYVEIVGNGTSNNAKSNARTLDWSGNESLAGGLTLGKGTADEVTITAAQLKALLALLNT